MSVTASADPQTFPPSAESQRLAALLQENASRQPDLYSLAERLRRNGGGVLCPEPEPDPELEKILLRGVVFPKPIAHRSRLTESPVDSLGPQGGGAEGPERLRSAIARHWRAHAKSRRIAIGYALGHDGIWRRHTWIAAAEEREPDPCKARHWSVVELAESRCLYYGYVLVATECARFAETCGILDAG